jgi:hypothetical protein
MKTKNIFTTCFSLNVVAFLFSMLSFSCSGRVKEDKTTSDISQPAVTLSYNDYLSAKDIEKVAGITGVKLIQKDGTKGAGGHLNFAASDDNLIVMIQFVHISQYEGYKLVCKEISEIKGLGDQAMKGSTIISYPENVVVFTKGNTCIALMVYGNLNDLGKNMLTIEQTTELAKIIASRI